MGTVLLSLPLQIHAASGTLHSLLVLQFTWTSWSLYQVASMSPNSYNMYLSIVVHTYIHTYIYIYIYIIYMHNSKQS